MKNLRSVRETASLCLILLHCQISCSLVSMTVTSKAGSLLLQCMTSAVSAQMASYFSKT